jgi:hypothetical protein
MAEIQPFLFCKTEIRIKTWENALFNCISRFYLWSDLNEFFRQCALRVALPEYGGKISKFQQLKKLLMVETPILKLYYNILYSFEACTLLNAELKSISKSVQKWGSYIHSNI